jgi:ribosomal protection tetracycline resistance protein
MRILGRLGIPTIVYVNKIDRLGAREGGLLQDIAERLTPKAVSAPSGTSAPAGRPTCRMPLTTFRTSRASPTC